MPSCDGCDDGMSEHGGCAADARNRPTPAALAQGLAGGVVCIAGVAVVLQFGAVLAGGAGAEDALDSSNSAGKTPLLTQPAIRAGYNFCCLLQLHVLPFVSACMATRPLLHQSTNIQLPPLFPMVRTQIWG